MPGITGWCGSDVGIFRVGSTCYTEHGVCLTECEMHESTIYVLIQSSHRRGRWGNEKGLFTLYARAVEYYSSVLRRSVSGEDALTIFPV